MCIRDRCKCGQQLSTDHLIKYCPLTTQFFSQDLRSKTQKTQDLSSIFEDPSLLIQCAENLTNSPLENLL